MFETVPSTGKFNFNVNKGMKGYRTERKKVKDEDTKEILLNFEGLLH
jgi:hypothetical protein